MNLITFSHASLVFIYHLSFPKYIKGCSKRMYCFDFAFLYVQFSLLTLSILCCPSCCEPLVNVTLWAGARYLTQEPELCAFVLRGCQFKGKCESIENNGADGALGIHGCLFHWLQDSKQITEFLVLNIALFWRQQLASEKDVVQLFLKKLEHFITPPCHTVALSDITWDIAYVSLILC